ncbi:MAG: AI-2E family transporter [Telluria sp.]
MEARTTSLARIGAVLLLLVGCLFVLRPFLAAILFAAAVSISTWPLFLRLERRFGHRRTTAALTMTLSLTCLVILPLALVAYTLADDAAAFYEQVRNALATGSLEPPAWLHRIPLVGDALDDYLRRILGSRDELQELAQRLLEPARHYLGAAVVGLGGGVAQVSIAAFVSFFLYRDGAAIARALAIAMERLIGPGTPDVMGVVVRTVRSVMYGLLGTALAQAAVAAVGFAIAGVPAVPILSVLTFLLSLVPVGPPLIWGGAAWWLFDQGHTGWGVFMLLWGLLGISSVDNFVKPILISRGSALPFLLVFLGVLGGVVAFGFVGLFIGPTLLAVAYSLVRDWTGVHPEGPL